MAGRCMAAEHGVGDVGGPGNVEKLATVGDTHGRLVSLWGSDVGGSAHRASRAGEGQFGPAPVSPDAGVGMRGRRDCAAGVIGMPGCPHGRGPSPHRAGGRPLRARPVRSEHGRRHRGARSRPRDARLALPGRAHERGGRAERRRQRVAPAHGGRPGRVDGCGPRGRPPPGVRRPGGAVPGVLHRGGRGGHRARAPSRAGPGLPRRGRALARRRAGLPRPRDGTAPPTTAGAAHAGRPDTRRFPRRRRPVPPSRAGSSAATSPSSG